MKFISERIAVKKLTYSMMNNSRESCKQLVDPPKQVLKPAWRGDGRVVLRRLPEKVQSELYVRNVEDTHPRQREIL